MLKDWQPRSWQQNPQPSREVEGTTSMKRINIELAEVWDRLRFRTKVAGVKDLNREGPRFWWKNG